MTRFEFERWDEGRLIVNRDEADLLRANGLTTFESIMGHQGGTLAKNLLRERTTTQISLPDNNGSARTYFLKRHRPSPWKEYLKPLLRATWPILGARNEWQAIIRFQECGISTMIPVALGESGRHSFLMTKAIEGCTKLTRWMANHAVQRRNGDARETRRIIAQVAGIARTMHAAGMHHQDFYLTHFLVPDANPEQSVYVIDLGRARKHRHLSHRWIVKDLAQLDYSAHLATRTERGRFLAEYLGRSLCAEDRPLIRRIRRKSAAIARHSRKNRL